MRMNFSLIFSRNSITWLQPAGFLTSIIFVPALARSNCSMRPKPHLKSRDCGYRAASVVESHLRHGGDGADGVINIIHGREVHFGQVFSH